MEKQTNLKECVSKAKKNLKKVHLNVKDKDYDHKLNLYLFMDNALSYTERLTTKQIKQLQDKLDKFINKNLPF